MSDVLDTDRLQLSTPHLYNKRDGYGHAHDRSTPNQSAPPKAEVEDQQGGPLSGSKARLGAPEAQAELDQEGRHPHDRAQGLHEDEPPRYP